MAMRGELASRLEAFFATYADPQYDVWKGGRSKAKRGRRHKQPRCFKVDSRDERVKGGRMLFSGLPRRRSRLMPAARILARLAVFGVVAASAPVAWKLVAAETRSAASGVVAAEGWQPLFDGTSLAGWKRTEFYGAGAVAVDKAFAGEVGAIVIGGGFPDRHQSGRRRRSPDDELRDRARRDAGGGRRLLLRPDVSRRQARLQFHRGGLGRHGRRAFPASITPTPRTTTPPRARNSR